MGPASGGREPAGVAPWTGGAGRCETNGAELGRAVTGRGWLGFSSVLFPVFLCGSRGFGLSRAADPPRAASASSTVTAPTSTTKTSKAPSWTARCWSCFSGTDLRPARQRSRSPHRSISSRSGFHLAPNGDFRYIYAPISLNRLGAPSGFSRIPAERPSRKRSLRAAILRR